LVKAKEWKGTFMNPQPITLEGSQVRLEPLSLDHHAPLCEVGLEPELWKLTTVNIRTPEDMRVYIETALGEQASGISLPFATVDKQSGRVVGSTRFGNINRQHRCVEIGWTWIAPPWQRTVVNTEAKYLMLCHAFEGLGCIRVELKTDSLNERSKNAMRRIGAREEGTFRNHMILQSGRIRHSVFFSIIDSEWPDVKAGLEAKLGRDPVSV
jgi:RimJ/RimL family protein N-acetyltransferase